MKKPFSLISSNISHDVVEALEFLLDRARDGEVFGIAYVAQMRPRNIITDTAGEAHRNPLFSLGLVRILEDALVERVKHPE